MRSLSAFPLSSFEVEGHRAARVFINQTELGSTTQPRAVLTLIRPPHAAVDHK